MARDLLPRLWDRLVPKIRDDLSRVIYFHHPSWDGREATLPEIEELLTEFDANEELLESLRSGGHFNVSKLQGIRDELLLSIAEWFHEIHKNAKGNPTVQLFTDRLLSVPSAVISFNWDYELDKALFAEITPAAYGLSAGTISVPVLLKPHGSLNWYPAKTGRHLKRDRREMLWSEKDNEVYGFLRWRAPKSEGKRYVPWIVPPTHLKDFSHGMLRMVWKRCVETLSVAKKVYFLGYSLPIADWHSRYILRCGFHNQKEGLPLNGKRAKPTGKSKVHVVNPDPAAFRRIEAVVGWHCEWVPTTVSQWLEAGDWRLSDREKKT